MADGMRGSSGVLTRYDGTLDTFITCSRQYFIDKAIEAGEWGTNDNTDLHHLAYLQNPLCAIVTDDKLLTRLLRRAFPRQILSVVEYRGRFLSAGG